MKVPAFVCLFLLPLSSCFLSNLAVNEPLDPELVSSLTPGTSATAVVKKMGAPDEVVRAARSWTPGSLGA